MGNIEELRKELVEIYYGIKRRMPAETAYSYLQRQDFKREFRNAVRKHVHIWLRENLGREPTFQDIKDLIRKGRELSRAP